MPIIVSLEGNIGAGKTTFLKDLSRQCPDYTIVLEPVDEWTTKYGGDSILELFYADKTRWAFTFQNFAVQTLVTAVKKVLASGSNTILVTERSALTSRYVFAQMLKDTGYMTELEWALYLRMFEDYSFPLSGIIYLTTDPETSAQRIMERGRQGETVSLDYLKELDSRHKAWLDVTDIPLLRLAYGDVDAVKEFISGLTVT
jgi:deoxyadenosine/deoxycytidine kinase